MSRTQPALQEPDQAWSPERSCPAPSTAIRVGARAAGGNSRSAWPGPARPSGLPLYSLDLYFGHGSGYLFLHPFIHSRTHSFSHPPIHPPIHKSFLSLLRPLCLLFPSYFPVFFPLLFPLPVSPALPLAPSLCLSAPLASPTTFLTHSPIFSLEEGIAELGFED